MEFKNFENVPCIWKPPGDKGVYYSKFVELVEEKYKIKIENYWDLHKWSVENIDKFWGELWYFTGIIYSKTFNQVIDLSIPLSQLPKWFIGAELNFAENILRHRDDHVAIVAIGEDREKRIITYAEMYEEVKRYTSAFQQIGLKKGDIIVGYASNREEIIFAMLGANAIGAVFTGVLPLLGAQAVLDRLKLVHPTILISVDRLRYNQEEVNMLPKLQEITNGLPTLMKTIIVPSKPDSEQKDIGSIAESCFLKEFLDLVDDPVPDIEFEQVAFSHPIVISYTSGTTGPPKALIHDFGCFLNSVRDQCFLSDFGRRGRSLSVSPPGWATWLFSIYAFYSGSSTVLFEGEPFLLSPTYFWDMVEEHKITGCLISPKNLDDLEKRNYVPTEKHKLSSLYAIMAASSIVKPHNYDFVCKKINPGIFFCSVYGCTELMSSCMSFQRTLPIYQGEIACPSLGADVKILDETGKSVEGILGDMVIAKPLPGISLGMYGDVDGIKFRESYFSKFPGMYRNKYTFIPSINLLVLSYQTVIHEDNSENLLSVL